MIPDVRGAKVLLCGLQGGGKTYKAKEIVKKQNLKVLVYSPHRHDFIDEPDNFIYYTSSDYIGGFKRFCELAKKLVIANEIDGIFVDEFDMLFRSNFDMNDVFIDLTSNHRHFGNNGMCIIGITRRPQDIPTRFAESCKIQIIFSIEGDNAKKKFNGIYSGFGEMISKLEYGKFDYYLKEIGKPPILCHANDI